MANAIVGTFILLGQAAVLGVPVGVLGGVFLSEYGASKLNWWIRFAADILNGVPSITWGIVVYGADGRADARLFRAGRRRRAGLDDDSAGDAHDRGSVATGARRLSRSRARAGNFQMENHRANRRPHRAQGHCHRRVARARARRGRNRAAAVHRFRQPSAGRTA